MTDDNRLRTAAMLSELWDGKPVTRVRAGDGISVLQGRRLSVHLMIQPDAAAPFLADPTMRDRGLLSRLLVAAPESLAGTRLFRETAPADDQAIKAYGARILALLEMPPPLIGERPNELSPRVLSMDDAATNAWKGFLDHVEKQCGPDRGLRPILDFAAKAAEHAARLAAVISVVENPRASEIDLDAMTCGIRLADWYVKETLRLAGGARTDPKLLRAQDLLDWMHKRGEREVAFSTILQFGPRTLRTKASADEAVATLIDHRWLAEISKRPRRFSIAAQREAKG